MLIISKCLFGASNVTPRFLILRRDPLTEYGGNVLQIVIPLQSQLAHQQGIVFGLESDSVSLVQVGRLPIGAVFLNSPLDPALQTLLVGR